MKSFAIALAVISVGALWLVAFSRGGSTDRRLPVNGKVKRVSPKVLSVGDGKITAWHWTMWATDRPQSSSSDHVCFSVNVAGPLVPLPGKGSMGTATGSKKCGPINPNQGAVVAIPIEEGEVTPPTGKTESWQSFDAGIAAYPSSVDEVRLVFSDGDSEALKARAVPRHLEFKNAEPFHYVVFAVKGCVSQVQSLVRGMVVARAGQQECNASSG